FNLGMEYEAGQPGSAGEVFDFEQTQQNTFQVDNCEIQVFVRDDQSDPQNTATIARELIDVEGVNLLVGTVSSGATATLQGIAMENQIPLIVAPAAANDITGKDFNEYTFRVSRAFRSFEVHAFHDRQQSFGAGVPVGVTDEMALGSTFIDNALMPTFFGNAIGTTSGILYHYTAPDNPINDWLTEQTQARYGLPPDLFAADGMNAAIMAVEALRATNGDASAEALLPVMEGMEFEGPKGTIQIRPEDHVAIQDMYILTLTNLTDPDFKFYDYVSTNRPQPPCLLPEELKDRCGDLPYGSLTGE
ncbi:MAG: ABC transporter substrate-binding protein, partial [Anaerolineales bacterium]